MYINPPSVFDEHFLYWKYIHKNAYSLQMEDLIAHYKTESGSLPCKLFYAATKEKETQFCSTKESRPSDIFNKCDSKLRSKFRAKRRKENVNIEDILIVNRES